MCALGECLLDKEHNDTQGLLCMVHKPPAMMLKRSWADTGMLTQASQPLQPSAVSQTSSAFQYTDCALECLCDSATGKCVMHP